MTITAKYPSRCAACGRAIRIGEKIEWTKGQPVRHAHCGGQASTTRQPIALAPGLGARRSARRQLRDDEQEIFRDSHGYAAGDVVRLHGSTQWLTVTACGSYRISEAEDDTREGERRYWAHARIATDTEARAADNRASAKVATAGRVAAARKLIETGEGQGRGWQQPAGSRTIADEIHPGSMVSYPYLVLSPDGTVYHVRPVYDDDSVVHALPITVDEAVTAATTLGWRIQ